VCLKGPAGLRPVRVLGALLLTSRSSRGRSGPGRARERIEDLARCEPVCGRFLECGVETTNDAVIFTVTNPSTGMERADADVTLDAFDVLPTTRAPATRACWSGSPTAARHVGEAGEDRWELRVCASSPSRSVRGGLLQGIGSTLRTPPPGDPSRSGVRDALAGAIEPGGDGRLGDAEQ
jgi:hypothetical protein